MLSLEGKKKEETFGLFSLEPVAQYPILIHFQPTFYLVQKVPMPEVYNSSSANSALLYK